VGMGKSTAARFFEQQGAAVVDTDALARELVQPGQPALAQIQAAFGKNLVAPDGQLRRDKLAQIVFADAPARQQLEAILHPRIRERWLARIASWRRENRPLAVVVIPLLFETHAEPQFDKIVCVACTSATQRQRLVARGWSGEQIAQRLAAQWPIEQKVSHSDLVVWTEGGLDVCARQIDQILAQTTGFPVRA